MDSVRVRFAPSPTGYLHIGGARTALYNWLFARKHGGTFILRIEDTDVERSTEESIREIIDGLRWLGLDWDEGPYFQSHYRHEHQAAAERLLQEGHAYRCFCTKEEREEKRKQAERAQASYQYDRTCRYLSAEEVAARLERGTPYVVRFKVPEEDGAVVVEDIVYGTITKRYRDIEDFVIVRSDGFPLYLLSNAVDDIRDRISHVIRGQDGLANTPRQILIYRALGATPPAFAHMSLTLDPQRAKISKRRHGEVVTVSFYKEHGFLPWALCNFLLLLGWSTEDNREILSRREAIEEFSLERISKANSVFNYVKDDPKFFTDPRALSINSHYLRTMDVRELCPLVAEELKEAGLWKEEYQGERREWFEKTVDLIRTRYHTLKDFARLGRPYFSEDFPLSEEAVEKNLKKDPRLKDWLPELADRLEAVDPFTAEAVEKAVRGYAEEKGEKPGLFINAARAAVTGQLAGPGLFEILEAIGRASTVSRLRRAAERIQL